MTVALLGGTALAQPANSPPANLPNSARSAPDYDDDNAPPPGYGPPPGYYQNGPQQGPPPGYQNGPEQGPPQSAQQAQADRDMFCRRDAAARTGYTTPEQAASHEQANGTIGGTLGGAALGAVLGAAAGNPGLGAAAGAGAGLIAGTAVGSDNARRAASSVQAAYADAYYACMHGEGQQAAYGPNGGPYGPPPPGYGYPYPPPPPYYYGYGPYPYYPYYYGPGVTFGFGFGHGFHGGGFRHR
ncbi:MAG TPA: YMGG-like glycine zipper-containing protein [Rhizomicrobium sp.]